MPQASYVQSSFLGGEIAPSAQGAMHDPLYKASLDLCQNYLPLEEHSLTRRTGFKFSAVTKAGGVARNWTFLDAQKAAYNIEAGGGYFRFFKNRQLILESTLTAVQSVSAATPAVVGATAHPFATNDYVMFTSLVGAPILRNRQFIATKLSSGTFSIADPQSGSFVGTAVSGFVSANVQRVYQITHPYDSGEIFSVYVLQDQNQQVLLHPSVAPQLLGRTAGTDTFAITVPTFIDGPYLDPPTDGSTLTPDAVVGTITLTASSIASINGGAGFKLTDVGRSVRLFSQPPAWASGTTYAVGALVTYNGAYFSALKSGNTNNRPDVQYTWWAVAPTAATWVWGVIGTFTDTTHVIIQTKAMSDGSTPSLLNTNAITTWQLGLYSNTTGYPSCGVFHEGRLWLASPGQPNRFDGSKTDKHFDFSPTSADGTVADDNAVAVTAQSDDANPIFWMKSTPAGIIAGTQGGEFNIQASSLSDPITPTSIQIHKVTKFGSSSVRPAELPAALAVLQSAQRKIYEYKVFIEQASFDRAFNGINLSLRARHLMETGIAQLEYQRDPSTVLWARRNDGLLVGATYQRNPQSFFTAWHRQPLAGQTDNNASVYPALVQSMAVVPTPDGFSEDLWAVIGRKVPGIIAPDATPNAPVIPSDTVYDPIFIEGGITYDIASRVQFDEPTSDVFVTAQASGGLTFGLAKYDLAGNQLVAHKIDSDGTGNGYALGIPSPPLALAPSGQYIIGCQNSVGLSNSRIFVLNRTTLAHVQHQNFGGIYQQLLAVDSTETFVFGCDPNYAYAYHIPSNTALSVPWATLSILNQPTSTPQDAAFDASGYVWISEADGHLEKYQLVYDGVKIIVTKFNTYLPHNDGVGILKLTYNPAHNHMLCWYVPSGTNSGSGRMTRFALSGTSVFGDYTYPWYQPLTGLAGVSGWYAARTNWHDTIVYADIQVTGTGGNPQIWFFNSTDGNTQSKLRSFWPGADFWQEEHSSFLNTNAHEVWAQRGTGAGFEVLSYDIGPFAVDDIGLGDGTTHYMEFMAPMIDDDTLAATPSLGFFVDSGRTNLDDTAAVSVSNGTATVTGLHYLEGETIAVMADGVDQGDFTVLKGQILVPSVSASPGLTFGYPVVSIARLLPDVEAGGANGPAAFKTRRNHKYGILLHNTQGIEVTEDDRQYDLDALINEETNQKTIAPNLFSGFARENVQGADYSFRGKLCFRQKRPYPGTVLAVGPFLDVVDI